MNIYIYRGQKGIITLLSQVPQYFWKIKKKKKDNINTRVYRLLYNYVTYICICIIKKKYTAVHKNLFPIK